MLLKHMGLLILSSAFPLCLNRSLSAPVSLSTPSSPPPPPPLPPTHNNKKQTKKNNKQDNNNNNKRAVEINQSLCSKLVARQKLCKCLTWRCSVMSESHRSKGGATDEVFQGQCFLWERVASVAFYIHKKLYKTLKGRKKQNRTIVLLYNNYLK